MDGVIKILKELQSLNKNIKVALLGAGYERIVKDPRPGRPTPPLFFRYPAGIPFYAIKYG